MIMTIFGVSKFCELEKTGEFYGLQKNKRGRGGVPELITLMDIFVFDLRHNRWCLCEVIMGYEFSKRFKISKIVLSHCFQAWNN